ncbi:hypothetical protein LINGRAPRIM_LOCUS63 [Linum grandiflorum]
MIVYAFILDKDGRKIEKALKTRRWGTVGRDGSRVLLELDEYGVPIGEEGCFLRQVNGKIVKNRQFDIGAKNWHKVTTAQKDHVFDNHIRVRRQLTYVCVYPMCVLVQLTYVCLGPFPVKCLNTLVCM